MLKEWLPCEDGGGEVAFSQCNIFVQENEEGACRKDLKFKKCDSWIFDSSIYGETAATEYSLVCDRLSEQALVQDAFIFGMLAGVFLSGWISDSFGRKKGLMVFNLLHLVLGTINVFAWEVVSFSVSMEEGAFSIIYLLHPDLPHPLRPNDRRFGNYSVCVR